MATPKRIDTNPFDLGFSNAAYTGGGVNYIIETPTGVVYLVLSDINSDTAFCKSMDGGITWEVPVVLKAINTTQVAVWYDRWSGIDGDLIHVVYTDSATDDVFYRNINTANSDSLSTEYTVFAGSTTASGGSLSISRMRGGNLIIVGSIDAAAEVFSRKSTDVGANWSDIAAGYESGGNSDQCIVMPGWDADNQDAMMFYYDRSATEISVKYYDDSANSWSETSIATTISFPDHASLTFGHMNAAVDLVNSQNLFVFWTAIDTANADLRCFKVTQSAQTETTSNVVLNSTDDQGFCCISIWDSTWYVFYCGKSDGSETYSNNLRIYYKTSIDSGETWSSETQLSTIARIVTCLFGNPLIYKNFGVSSYYNTVNVSMVLYNSNLSIPRANYVLGI